MTLNAANRGSNIPVRANLTTPKVLTRWKTISQIATIRNGSQFLRPQLYIRELLPADTICAIATRAKRAVAAT